MKKTYHFMYQILVIGSVMLVSKIIEMLLPFSLPSSVIGLVLLFVLLSTKVIKLEQIETVGSSLVNNVGLFFVPAGIGAIKSLNILKENPFGDLAVIILATIILLICTGFSTQLFLGLSSKKIKAKNTTGIKATLKEAK